jgi:DNA-binding transcriptional ArsR family regulator
VIIQPQRSICPRCGTVVPVRPPILTETSIDIWEAGGRLFWLGKCMTIRALAKKTGRSPSTVHAHLLRLVQAGLVERVPLGTPGRNGLRQRHEYRGCLSRAVS